MQSRHKNYGLIAVMQHWQERNLKNQDEGSMWYWNLTGFFLASKSTKIPNSWPMWNCLNFRHFNVFSMYFHVKVTTCVQIKLAATLPRCHPRKVITWMCCSCPFLRHVGVCTGWWPGKCGRCYLRSFDVLTGVYQGEKRHRQKGKTTWEK